MPNVTVASQLRLRRTLHRMLLCPAVESPHMVLEPPPRGIECIADSDMHVLVRVILARLAVHGDRAAWHGQIDADIVNRAWRCRLCAASSTTRHAATRSEICCSS
jgi:hypothetical protein